jgi:hypothetical protein
VCYFGYVPVEPISKCCGSGIFIPDPDFCPSRIPDPKTATKFDVLPFFCSHKYHKIKNHLFFNRRRKNLRLIYKEF